jgi:hypothetical protein
LSGLWLQRPRSCHPPGKGRTGVLLALTPKTIVGTAASGSASYHVRDHHQMPPHRAVLHGIHHGSRCCSH